MIWQFSRAFLWEGDDEKPRRHLWTETGVRFQLISPRGQNGYQSEGGGGGEPEDHAVGVEGKGEVAGVSVRIQVWASDSEYDRDDRHWHSDKIWWTSAIICITRPKAAYGRQGLDWDRGAGFSSVRYILGFSQHLASWWVPSDLHDTSWESDHFSLQTLFRH